MKKKQLNRRGVLSKTFLRLKQEGRKALVPFITAGDPDLETTKKLIFALEKSGADVIELGVPFSDPVADGPTIQASSERALKKGTTLEKVLRLVREVRRKSDVPIVLFGYYNPVFSYGVRKFAADAKRAGCDGVLIVDLPPEEARELKGELKKTGIDLIYLLTPTSDSSRMKLVAKYASGFVYYVSVTGVTGARKTVSKSVAGSVKKLKKYIKLPVAVGFGVSNPQQAVEVASVSDGVVIGSAIVNRIAKAANGGSAVREVSAFVSGIRRAIDR